MAEDPEVNITYLVTLILSIGLGGFMFGLSIGVYNPL